jgi:16S rRNA (adenine1518-N6/adenine1519-N6)-dimethyltransferase
VPPGALVPPPKVNSAVVRLQRRPDPPDRPDRLLGFVSRCFALKRKTLRNNLRPYYAPALVDALPEAGLRAEQLTIPQFADLERRLRGTESGSPPNPPQ